MASQDNKADGCFRRPGLRERKRQQTRERLTEAAMALFLERGFEATTLDDIVAAADISRRNFFHYFASKEDVVFSWQDAMDAELNAAVAEQPPEVPPLRAAVNGILAIIGHTDRQDALAMGRLIHGTPALRARDQAKYEALERSLATTLGRRIADDPSGLRARLIAMAAIGALRVATEIWLTEGGREAPDTYARRVFDALRADLAE